MSATNDQRLGKDLRSTLHSEQVWWVLTAVATFMVAVVIPLCIAQRYDALGIVRSDDWSYIRALFEWSDSGRVDFNGWVSMTLIGQLALARPVVAIFGDSVAAVHVFGAVIGWIGVLAIVVLGRLASLGRGTAFLAGIVVAASPMWSTLAPTFMTDIPAFTFCALALAAAARAATHAKSSTVWLAASLTFAFIAVSIRQYAIVVLGAVLLMVWALEIAKLPVVRRRALSVLSVAAVGAVGILLVWWAGIPTRLSLAPQTPTISTMRQAFTAAGGFLRLAALLQLPLVLLARPVDVVRRARESSKTLFYSVLALTTTGLVASYALDIERPFVGNYVDRRGALGDLIIHGQRPYVMPRFAFDFLVVVASGAAMLLTVACIPAISDVCARIRRHALFADQFDPVTFLLASVVGGMFIVHEFAILVGFPIFDRYILPSIGCVGILLLRSSRTDARSESSGRAWLIGAVTAAVGLGGLGVVFAQESASFDAVRWQAAELALDAEFAPEDVYAGYEWRGYQTGKAPGFHTSAAERKRHRKLYFEGVCVETKVVDRRSPPEVNGRVVAVVRTQGWLRPDAWIVASATNRRCASGKSTDGYR